MPHLRSQSKRIVQERKAGARERHRLRPLDELTALWLSWLARGAVIRSILRGPRFEPVWGSIFVILTASFLAPGAVPMSGAFGVALGVLAMCSIMFQCVFGSRNELEVCGCVTTLVEAAAWLSSAVGAREGLNHCHPRRTIITPTLVC